MEEQEQNRRPEGGENHQKSGRHRRHRGHRRPAEQRTEGAPAAVQGQQLPKAAESKATDNKAPDKSRPEKNEPREKTESNEKKGNKPNKNNNRQGNDKSQKENREQPRSGNRNRDRQRGNAKKHRDQGGRAHRGPEDLYGAPTEDDVLTMEELRAKIVLQAADGSVPAKEAPAEPTVAAESAVEVLPTADDDWLYPSAPVAAVPTAERVEVVGIRFRSAGKVYYFDPKGNSLRYGDFAIVETARGPEFGEVSFGNRTVNKKDTVSPLRPVLRVATKEDIAHNEENRQKEKEALGICQQKIAEHRLEMKLIDVQYAFDNSKLLFYFTSDGRVDFRDLVKDLASVFRTRIELRQIGIRDEAKMLGGLGACGRSLCCASFLPDFVQVSIKMAKEQNLSLNSAKISGVCGRLMCCLRYEADVYAEEIRRTPPHGASVKTEDGIGTVIGSNPLAGTVKVALKNAPDTPPKQYPRDAVTVISRKEAEETDKNN